LARRWVAVIVVSLLATTGLAWQAQPASTAATHDGGPQRRMVFPVVGQVTFTDTFGAARDGGRRRHEGQDLMGAKMAPLVATVDGVITKLTIPESAYGYAIVLTGDDGWMYRYIHVNNDSLGTDDDHAPLDLVYGPGIRKGVHVRAGQLLGYLGDSGNAESTRPHVHFELRSPEDVAVNAYNALLHAPHIDYPVGLPAGFDLPPLGTTKATPRQQTARSTTTTRPKSPTTTRPKSTSTTKPAARRGTTTTTRKTTTTSRPKSTTTTARRSTTTTTRKTTTTTRPKSTTTTRRTTTTR
jgi:murein DD-endopeptidase MepM/ murein hydrolase activator NlpD